MKNISSFDCILIEDGKSLSDCLTFKLFYYLDDSTIAVKELKENAEGRGYVPMLLRRTRVPKHTTQMLNNVETLNAGDAYDFLQPEDLLVGKEIVILGHRFLLNDCNAHTRAYYKDVLNISQNEKLVVEKQEKDDDKQRSIKIVGVIVRLSNISNNGLTSIFCVYFEKTGMS